MKQLIITCEKTSQIRQYTDTDKDILGERHLRSCGAKYFTFSPPSSLDTSLQRCVFRLDLGALENCFLLHIL